jgi:hypothetical protein
VHLAEHVGLQQQQQQQQQQNAVVSSCVNGCWGFDASNGASLTAAADAAAAGQLDDETSCCDGCSILAGNCAGIVVMTGTSKLRAHAAGVVQRKHAADGAVLAWARLRCVRMHLSLANVPDCRCDHAKVWRYLRQVHISKHQHALLL